jgi:hypothetical protein
MTRTRRRQRPWSSSVEQARLAMRPDSWGHLRAAQPCLWYAGDRWREGLVLELDPLLGALVLGQHYGRQIRADRVSDGRNVMPLAGGGR